MGKWEVDGDEDGERGKVLASWRLGVLEIG